MRIDINSDLGEGYGPWVMGDDAALLRVVTSANLACGGHAGDPETMFATLQTAAQAGVVVGAHPGYLDPLGFGRRIIPMSPPQITRMVAAQIGALQALATLANLAADDPTVAEAIVQAVKAMTGHLSLLAISGTELELAGRRAGLQTFSEVFADRAYLPNGRLVPRKTEGAVLHDAEVVSTLLLRFLERGEMPVLGGGSLPLAAQSICVHGDSPDALGMAQTLRARLTEAGHDVAPFL